MTDRINILGVGFDSLTMDEAVSRGMGLIVVGGIGFIVWRDIARHGIHFQRYELHSKIALTTTAILLVGATVLFVIFEHNHAFAGFTTGQAIMSLFSFFLFQCTATLRRRERQSAIMAMNSLFVGLPLTFETV